MRLKTFSILGLILGSALTISPYTLAQTPSEIDIINALLDRPKEADSVTGARSIFGKKKRGVTVEGGEDQVPSINLKVNFKFDSEKLENEALLTLNTLGRALSSDELEGQKIEIFGHTDAKGTDEYNNDLSERRAAAVVSYVVSNFGLDATLISSKGLGEQMLLDPESPESEVNRRVEIRNITDAQN